jgi:hypothetical protein
MGQAMKKKSLWCFKDETELAQQVEVLLLRDGWEVYKEVEMPFGRADIVAVRDGIVWIIETKMQLSVIVAEQAYNRLDYAHYVSVATPLVTGSLVVQDFLERKGIGWLQVYYKPHAESIRIASERIKPKVSRAWPRTGHARKIRSLLSKYLRPEQKESVPGSNGGQVTTYSLTINRVEAYLQVHGPSTISDIIKNVEHHYSSNAGAKDLGNEAMYLGRGQVRYYPKRERNIIYDQG